MNTLASDTPAPPAGPARRWGHRPALDGLRALAVFLVLGFHAGITSVEGGFIGVDLFFVLSGFVVTNVIWSELVDTGSLQLRRFYARRMRRLTPAAIALVGGASLAFVLVASLPQRLQIISDARAALLYFANWHFLGESNDYFAETESPSPFLHFWSLSIEEQFYAGFPLVLLGLFLLGRRLQRRSIVPVGLGILMVASIIAQIIWSRRDAAWAYYGTDARLYQLLAGCLAAVLLREWIRAGDGRRYSLTACVGLVGLLAASTNQFDVTPSVRGFVAATCSLLIIFGLEHSPSGLLTRGLSLPTMTYLGGISYGIYLWHWPVILVLDRLLEVRPITIFVLASVLSSGLAALSYQLLEHPIRRAKKLDGAPRAVVIGGLACTVVMALVVTPPILRSTRTPRIVESATITTIPTSASIPTGFNDPVPSDIDYEGIRTFRVDVPNCSVEDLSKCTVRTGSNEHVLLVGDSIAQELIPAFEQLADNHDWTLSLNVFSACTWQLGVAPRPDLAEPKAERCRRTRAEWYPTAIEALRPDVIVFVSLLRDDPDRWTGIVTADDPALADAPPAQIIATTTRQTLDFLEQYDTQVVLIEPTPISPDRQGSTVCLGGASTIGQCSFELTPPAPTDFAYRAEAAMRPWVHSVSLNPMICPDDPICMPIIDGTVTWRDDGHLSHLFVDKITPDIGELLQSTGAFDPSG